MNVALTDPGYNTSVDCYWDWVTIDYYAGYRGLYFHLLMVSTMP